MAFRRTEEWQAWSKRVRAGDSDAIRGRDGLLSLARWIRARRAEAVTDKPSLPWAPSPDRHSYQSIATYYWPNPNTPDGLPFVERDGMQSPLLADYDYPRWRRTADGIAVLTRAGVVVDQPNLLRDAAERLRSWFVDPATAMRPHLDNAQFAPGCNTGRAAGVIDFAIMLPGVLGDAEIRARHPGSTWSATDTAALGAWCEKLLEWLTQSPIARAEDAADNNHGVYFDVLIASVALYVGDVDFARRRVARAVETRLGEQMRPDGGLPRELDRTLSLTYTVLHLGALCLLAQISRRVEIDFWSAQARDGQSIARGMEFLSSSLAQSPAGWPYPQITPLPPTRLSRLLVLAEHGLGAAAIGALFPDRLPDESSRMLLMADESANPLIEIRKDFFPNYPEVRHA